MFERSLLAGLALTLLPLQADAQDWRDVTSFRQRAEETALKVHARYGAGELFIRPGTGSELYRVDIRYDADTFDPVTRYESGSLEVGVKGKGKSVRMRDNESGNMTLWLSPHVPLDLDLDFGAVEAQLDLGGLRLSQMDIETGASDTRLGFTSPNLIDCSRMDIAMGAAALEARGLADANCRLVHVEGGVGDVTLDFSGHWKRDLEADVTIALGSVTFVVPEDVGVRVTQDTFLANFNGSRFSKRDGSRYSDNWDVADRRLTVHVKGAFGSIDVRWTHAATATP